MSEKSVRFSRGLPLVVLALASVLIACTLPSKFRLRQRLIAKWGDIDSRQLSPAMIRDMVLAADKGKAEKMPDPIQIAAFFNVPGMLVEVASSLPTTWPDSWYPMLPYPFGDLFFWRALSWPIVCLPLWWLAGRALDAIYPAARNAPGPKIRLSEVVVMATLGTGTGLIEVMVGFMPRSHVDDDNLQWVIVPGLLWCVLGVLPFIARRRQKRLEAQKSSLNCDSLSAAVHD